MTPDEAAGWLRAYATAWEEADARGVVTLFADDATYLSHPFRPAHVGREGIHAYWTGSIATQKDVRVRMGEPLVDGDRVVAEWWATMTEEGGPITLPGVLLLELDEGRCRALREYWALEQGRREPFPEWGRFGDAEMARERADAWAAAYAEAWGADDAGAAAATFSEDVVYRTHPFREPLRGRDEVRAYTEGAFASEDDRTVRVATFAASGANAAIEYWATYTEGGTARTLAGCMLGSLDDAGLVETGRDYWHEEEGSHPAPF